MQGADLLNTAIEACRQSTGVEIQQVDVTGSDDSQVVRDAFVSIAEQTVVVKVRRTVDRVATVALMAADLRTLQAHANLSGALLVTDYLSAQTLDQCRARQVNAIDAAGNAFISLNGLFIFVSGRPRLDPKERLGWSTPAVRLGLLALATPAHIGASQRNLSAYAGIAVGSVRSGLDWLSERGFIINTDTGPVVRNHRQFLGEWEVAYSARVRPKLNIERYSLASPIAPDELIALDVTPGVWSGDVGAYHLIGTLRPVSASVYLRIDERAPTRRRLFREQHLQNDPEGQIALLDRFWDFPGQPKPSVAPWPIVYADLLTTGDARAIEAAALIREKFLHE
jgi:hypothetical protein